MMFVAGAFISANLTIDDSDLYHRQYGWPIPAHKGLTTYGLKVEEACIELVYEGDSPKPQPKLKTLNETAILLDSTIAIGILLGVAFGSEYLIRRREARKP